MRKPKKPEIIATIPKSRTENILVIIDEFNDEVWIEFTLCRVNTDGIWVKIKKLFRLHAKKLSVMIEALTKARFLTTSNEN